MRLFERALARSGLPVRFSTGFNPRPKLSLPLPRSVGIATQADVLVVEFTSEVSCDDAVQRLAVQMPQGVKLQDAWVPQSSRPIQPESASYALEIPVADVPAVAEQAKAVMAAETWQIRRDESDAGPAKSLDLRKQLVEVTVEGALLQWTVGFSGGGAVRPVEVLKALGLDPRELQHRIQRTAITWRTDPVQPKAG